MNHISPIWRNHCAQHQAKRAASIGQHRPIIGAAHFMDKESDLLRAAKQPTPAVSGPYKRSEPPKWAQVLLGLLIAAAFLAVCFI